MKFVIREAIGNEVNFVKETEGDFRLKNGVLTLGGVRIKVGGAMDAQLSNIGIKENKLQLNLVLPSTRFVTKIVIECANEIQAQAIFDEVKPQTFAYQNEMKNIFENHVICIEKNKITDKVSYETRVCLFDGVIYVIESDKLVSDKFMKQVAKEEEKNSQTRRILLTNTTYAKQEKEDRIATRAILNKYSAKMKFICATMNEKSELSFS